MSSHDVTQFTKATDGNGAHAGASAMDVGRYRKLLSSSVQLENKDRYSKSRENDERSNRSRNRNILS